MKKVIFCISFVAIAFNVFAQNQYKVTVGASFDYGFKFTTKQNFGFSCYEPAVYVKVDGAEQNSLDFICRFGFLFDSFRFPIGSSSSRIDLIQNNFSFSGLICFPVKNENLKILAGIGLEYCNKPIVGYSSFGDHRSALSINSDSICTIIETHRRRVLPSISAGILYQPFRNKKIGTHFIFKQNLLNLFTEDLEIPYESGGIGFTTSTNYKPSYLKLGLSYDFW